MSEKRKQCKAITTKGKRCKGSEAHGTRGLCFYHYGYVMAWHLSFN